MTDDVHDKIVRRRVRRIAEAHGITTTEVERALDRHPVNAEPHNYLKRTLALELVELDELEHIFHEKAVNDSDPVSGALCVKIHERRATLLGLNPPQGHAVQIISTPSRHETSTAGLIDRLVASRPKAIPTIAEEDEDEDDRDGAAH